MKPNALIAAALGVAAWSAAQAEPVTYTIEPTHTFVTFEIGHFGTSTNRGRFDKKEGTVVIDKATKTGQINLAIDPASINTGTAAFDKHLRGSDFFQVEKFPSVTFAGNQFTFNGDKVAEVTGNLTLLGKTNPVTLVAKNYNCYMSPMLKREVCGGDFEATLDRSQWGLSYGMQYGFPANVKLVIQVEAVRQ